MKPGDLLFLCRQTVALEQFTLTDNLHAQSAGTDECQQRLRHQSGTLAHGHGLIIALQVVHFEQHQTTIALAHPEVVAVLHLRGKADARQLAGVACGMSGE